MQIMTTPVLKPALEPFHGPLDLPERRGNRGRGLLPVLGASLGLAIFLVVGLHPTTVYGSVAGEQFSTMLIGDAVANVHWVRTLIVLGAVSAVAVGAMFVVAVGAVAGGALGALTSRR